MPRWLVLLLITGYVAVGLIAGAAHDLVKHEMVVPGVLTSGWTIFVVATVQRRVKARA